MRNLLNTCLFPQPLYCKW